MILHKAFIQDVEKNGGYAYTADRLSSRMSNARISKSILAMEDLRGKTIIDIGCGDGTYSIELASQGAKSVLAVDVVKNAIEMAAKKYQDVENLSFKAVDFYKMELPQEPYDVAVLRGVLHHLPDLEKGIEIACKLAKKIIVMEPNGYNPVLKIIEKTSRYHIEHHEQSFAPQRLRSLFSRNNGEVVFEEFVGLVPFFCPDNLAKILKFLEPWFEKMPLLKKICCGQFMFLVAVKNVK